MRCAQRAVHALPKRGPGAGARYGKTMNLPRTAPPLARSLHRALLLLGITLGCAGTLLLIVANPNWSWDATLYVLVFLVYLGAGIIAWWRRPGNRIGAIVAFGGIALLGAGLGGTDYAVLTATASITGTLILAVLVHLLLAFPSGQVRGTLSRTLVCIGYGNALILQIPSYLCDPESPLFVADLPWLRTFGDVAQQAITFPAAILIAVMLYRRLWRTVPEQRRLLIPLYAYGVVAVLFIPFSAGILEDLFGVSAWARWLMQLIALGGIPVAFVIVMLRGGFARSASLGDLGNWMGVGGSERRELVAALARTVGDPGLTLAFWVSDDGHYVDAQGAAIALPGADDRRGAVEVSAEGRRVAAVIYDTTLIADPTPVREAAQFVALELDRQRLVAELVVSSRALAEARARVNEEDGSGRTGIDHLTKRQREVLALIAEGRSNASIAAALHLTEKSVVNHISRLYDALGLSVESTDHRRVLATLRYLSR